MNIIVDDMQIWFLHALHNLLALLAQKHFVQLMLSYSFAGSLYCKLKSA